ncbi:MAG: helix-turn-helix domain-containing protein [Parafilimonas terrae]|nr:helix-turn-helix domain-containing protein [Parafilimonas terrae]
MPAEAQRRRGMVLVPLAYRIEDAAAAIGIGRSTLFEYIKDGRIPSRKIGNSTVIRHRDLEAFLDAAPLSAATKDAQRSMS